MTASAEKQAELKQQRELMVERQLVRRGVRCKPVLEAMAKVPREAFVPPSVKGFAYEDSPLPIDEGQTISQPYIVALMAAALFPEDAEKYDRLDKVLEIGTGSGYGAAVLAYVARQVISVERLPELARTAKACLREHDFDNASVVTGDGTLGWPARAPYDGIVVTAGGPDVPRSLTRQLAVGGRLVIPVGNAQTSQTLMRITRTGEETFEEEELLRVQFVPLVGKSGWPDAEPRPRGLLKAVTREPVRKATDDPATDLAGKIARVAEPISAVDDDDLSSLLERIGDARVVLIGEASHGTSEFYRYRAEITKALIEQKGFDFVAVEADWPDASRIDHYVRHRHTAAPASAAFTRFPTWMWRNEEVQAFVEWLRDYNGRIADPDARIGFYGLDLYSLYNSIGAVLEYLEEVDPDTAALARERYACLMPWQDNPARYGRETRKGRYRECEEDVVAMLSDLLSKRLEYSREDGARFLDAMQNARLVANAERYYRSLYAGYSESWNLRDQHMFDTLESLMEHGGENTRAIVWEHNSHVGNAGATDMVTRGQHNVGELCRQAYGNDAYLIGFGTHSGTVAAASDWDAPMEIKEVLPSLPESWEHRCYRSGVPAFRLPLRRAPDDPLAKDLRQSRLERAIGVIYRPESERASHYFRARLGEQFDEYIWFDHTTAITPLAAKREPGTPETWPFGV